VNEGSDSLPFLSGVVEGFYGRPWTLEQRALLFQRMSAWGLNTYLYAPKDDLKHRAAWRLVYHDHELAELEQVVTRCRGAGLRFVYAIGPGLDIGYGSQEDVQCLRDRFDQLSEIGVQDFALLFDDIPDAMSADDQGEFKSFASAQAFVTNQLFQECRERCSDSVFLFCPTPYCSRMDLEGLGGEDYLETLGRELDPSIHVFWTGPEIISKEISEEHISELRKRLQRAPLIWDNYHANDYDLRRLYTGPIDGRPKVASDCLSGVMLNPNCEFEANFVPVYSLGRYVSHESPYSAEDAFQSGLALWREEFEGVGDPWTEDELQLFASIFYLPFAQGPLAEEMVRDVTRVIRENPSDWGDAPVRFEQWRERIQTISVKLTELKNRDLFYTFNRQWWEIREEFELLARFVAQRESSGPESVLPKSPEHLPGTYRGGVIRELQGLLSMSEEGRFSES
jgi:protein O-GlcNAcase/histone acetyltransferase